MNFCMIKVSDLVLVNDKGEVIVGRAHHPVNSPAFAIHSKTQKARQGLNAACHANSVYGQAFTPFACLIEMI
ncbi:hypothetical protein BGW36DRAFT_439503 [Talaromyces proteolyticus]|uniref:Class II aldolase/adducin N-terminal domain-containing protein n=1 Tax=Talaromyces proteolyticus TaxID=1131652 RepID=A0AAD4PW97_9EURO|nr:uncharacterized protein BGW36DRAFT_439503 [Talaromyces proteolyticus]KAH8691672.1 hypothetical protein BGW36DRAFT_439503 [Talaromyces proteolyticus]